MHLFQVIKSCASCEDDCHPGRISGDDDTIKDCLKKCECMYLTLLISINYHDEFSQIRIIQIQKFLIIILINLFAYIWLGKVHQKLDFMC